MKHRIIGSLMFLSLAVIILPFWLDGAGLEEYKQTTPIPEMPQPSELVVIESIDPADPAIIELSPIITPAISSTPEQPTSELLKPNGLPNGWIVQLGSFGKKDNALRLTDKLIKAGFAAYMVPNDTVFRVLVGPELDRSRAEKLQQQLKIQFKMSGIVMHYDINKS